MDEFRAASSSLRIQSHFVGSPTSLCAVAKERERGREGLETGHWMALAVNSVHFIAMMNISDVFNFSTTKPNWFRDDPKPISAILGKMCTCVCACAIAAKISPPPKNHNWGWWVVRGKTVCQMGAIHRSQWREWSSCEGRSTKICGSFARGEH